MSNQEKNSLLHPDKYDHNDPPSFNRFTYQEMATSDPINYPVLIYDDKYSNLRSILVYGYITLDFT